jgi:alanine racemase
MLYLQYDFATIQNRISQLSKVSMRLEQKEGINNCTIINDSYNSDFTSLSIAIDFLNQQNQHANKTLILSDIQQSGFQSDYLYSQIAELVKNKSVNRFIGIGKKLQQYRNLFIANSEFYSSTQEFLKSRTQFKNETILLKGAREFEFEEINKQLQQKQHETTLEINLTALVNNYNYFKSLLKPTTKIMVMVKAYSYGSGSFEVANALQHNQVDYLAVAYADEGVELRNNGISLPIMVMNPEETSFDTLIEHNLEPEIYCHRILNAFEDYIKIKQIKNYPIHLKIDTGMNRLGFNPEEINEVATQVNNSDCFKVASTFSHLVGADEQIHDDFTNQQIKQFEKASSELESILGYSVIKHILNSNGIARFTNAQQDMVRLGIGIYGIVEPAEHQQKLEPVYTLQTTVSQIKHIKKGETIGYSRKGIATKNMTIATLPIGYADGINRKLGNGNCSFIVNNQACKTIGNICMDMCMIDVTGLTIKEGDKVEFFGKQQNIRVISDALQTIPYEVLTGISRRVKRVYFQE